MAKSKPREGDKTGLVTQEINEKLVEALEDDSQLTLKQLKDKLRQSGNPLFLCSFW